MTTQPCLELAQNRRNFSRPGTGREGATQLGFIDTTAWGRGSSGSGLESICLKTIGIRPGEPMAALAHQAIARLGIALEIPSDQQIVQPQQHRQVDLPRGIHPLGQTLLPGRQPGLTQCPSKRPCQRLPAGLLQPFHDLRHQAAGPSQQGRSLEMGIQIFRTGCPHADRVNPWGGEAKQVVENDGMQRRAQISHPR